ncbi:Hypothetical predicted protein [Paramuricea clavata]|nr:Hypothetical predicted protein [Paramuricea clavata]
MDKCYKRAITGSSVDVGMNATKLDQIEKEMIADIQKMFSTWRAQRDLEIGIAGPMEIQDVEQNGEQFSMKQSQQFPQQQPVSQQKL